MNLSERTVLFIDDCEDDLEFFSRLLERADGKKYRVLTALNAKEGARLYKAYPVDCVFIDYNMPIFDGLAFARELMSFSSLKFLPLVIVTGEPDSSIQAKAAKIGALDFVAKGRLLSPHDIAKVAEKVIAWAARLNRQGSVSAKFEE